MRVYSYNLSPKSAPQKTRKKPKNWRERLRNLPWKTINGWVLRVSAGLVIFIAILFIYYSRSLPDPNRLLGRDVPESTQIYDREGNLLYAIHGEANRTLVNLDQISDYVKQATVAVEDKDFYNHHGISIRGLVRSAVVDILHGSKRQGGSTITQQFVRNAVLTRQKSWTRKIAEIILSIEIEARFSKNDILKLYLNEIPYGRNAYGIEAASTTYFSKHAKDLTLAESAYLAALPQAPTYYNPFGPHRDDLDARQRHVLKTMKEQNYITEEQYNQALNEKVTFNQIKSTIVAPHFVFYVEDYLAEKYGEQTVQEGGLRVYTSLDPRLQKIAEEAVSQGVAKNATRYNDHNGALVAIDPKTGQILAMVGSKDYFGTPEPAGCTPGKNCLFEPNVNAATASRQPGSSFKPYVYVTAFSRQFGYAPASMLVDVVTNFGTFGGKAYVPNNFSGQNYGPVSMRQALAGSLNIPAVKTLDLVGVDNAIQTARSLGITTPLQNCGLSLVLGGCEVKLVDHVAAFSVFANGGARNEKTPIVKVVNQSGTVLEEYKQRSQQIIDPQANYELVSIMTDNAARSFVFGSNSALVLPGRLVAAKTGTTQNFKDGWTVGFTPSLAAGVWVGNNDGTVLKQDAVVVAGPIWNQFMKNALAGTPAEDFPTPNGITRVTVDSLSGKLPTSNSPSTKSEVFADYSVPKERDTVHGSQKVDRTTGLPPTDFTLPEDIEERPCLNLHSERPNNPNWENPVRAWAAGHGGCGSENPDQSNNEELPQVSITSPADNAIIAPGAEFTITMSAEGKNGVARVDVSIDGDALTSLVNPPYTVSVTNNYSQGQHTIVARAVDSTGASSAAASNFIVGSADSNTLTISDPSSNDVLNFPVNISASSESKYGAVAFYYEPTDSNKASVIGSSAPVNAVGLYTYSVTWSKKPKSGQYYLFARSNTGTTSSKITIIVPP